MDFSKLGGLLPAVVQDEISNEVLMVGFMNEEAWRRTRESGFVTFYSRTRQEIWHKGDTSGQVQVITELRVDCDQDAILMKVMPEGDGGACHVGFRSCFYRVFENGKLVERP